jgi:RHS repeat-associated protein
MKKITIGLLPLIFLWLQLPLIAQDVAPDDAATAMTIEAGEPIGNSDPANNEDVSPGSNYTPPESPFAPELPDSGNTYEGPVGVTGIFNGNVATGCSYDPLSHSAHREVTDIVVPNSLGKYPLKMTRYYNSRQQYYALTAIGLSPGWSHEYSWLLWGAGHKVVSPHGGLYDDYCGVPVGVSEGWEGAHSSSSGTWRLADGGKVIFSGGKVTNIYDPYGLRTRIAYDGNGQLVKVTEPGGRCLWFVYGPETDDDGTKMLKKVEAYDVDGSPGAPTLPTGQRTDWVNYSYTNVSAGVQGRNKKMLTGVAYSDGTSGIYEYRSDNVTEGQTTHKMYPLLQRCDDVRYGGSMRTIRYEYQNDGPHGAIINEKYPGIGAVSAIAPGVSTGGAGTIDTFTETRGDGPTRSFTYTHIHYCQGNECGPCDNYSTNGPDQQMLLSYTDFQGHTTILGYDSNWYINSVKDANNHTTAYQRGSPPPNGIGQITKITHPGGTHIDYSYYNEGTGKIGGHYLYTMTDERGNVTVYSRDGNYRVTSIDYKNNLNQVLAHEEFVYNSFGQVTRHKLRNGDYVHYQYDARGLLTKKWNPTANGTAQESDPKTTYSYWTNWVWKDHLYTETMPANGSDQVATEHYEYDRNGSGNACPGRGLVTKLVHADNKYQLFGYSQYGNKLWEENELRQRTTYTYDNYNRVLSIKNPLNKSETFDYLKPGTNSAYRHTTGSVYTHTSRTGIVTSNSYDQNWRKTSTTEASGALNLTTRFAYDYVGNPTDVTDPRNKITHNVYDNRNRKVSTTEASGTPLATTTVLHYDAASNVNQIDRPDGIQETKSYDGLNRMISHTVPRQVPGQNPINLTTHFYYNPSGTLQKVTDAKGHDTSFDYDASDRKLTMTYHANSGSQQWAYDNAGNLKSRTTVSGKRQDFTYDNLNRKIGMTWSNGADSASFTYDDASRLLTATNPNSTVTRAYDPAGRLTQDQQNVSGLGIKTVSYPLYDDDGKVKRISAAGIYDYTFGYDAAGRFETILAGGSTKFQYAYDAASNETHRYTYLSGVTIDQVYARDSLNRMGSRVLKENGTTFSSEAYSYDHMNRITEVTRGNLADNFGFYWSGDLMSAQYGGTPHMPFTEEQDPDLDTTDTVDPNANYQPPDTPEPEPIPPPDDYSDLPGGGPPPTLPGGRSVMYYLDRAGNRTQLSDTVNGSPTFSLNTINQYTAVTGCTISNGLEHEISSFKGPTDPQLINYYYVNDERLKQVTSGNNTYDLKYDALGRCVKRTLNSVTTYYIYDGEKPILDYKSNDLTHPAKNVYGKGIDEILMRTDPTVNSGNACYYGQDHEGSVTHLINASGDVIESYRYDAFGAPTMYNGSGTQIASTAYNNRFLFTGREYAATYQKTYTAAFSFYEYRARAYNPILGRFMSEDPKGFVRRAGLGKAPDDWLFAAHPDEAEFNLFRYCVNDPINNSDPTGLDSIRNEDGSYSYILQHNLSAQYLRGSYVEHGFSGQNVDRSPVQCARTARVLAGTQRGDGWHNAPSPEGMAWRQGAAVSNNTRVGSLVAHGWEHGVYPSKNASDESYKGHPEHINHAGIFMGLTKDGQNVRVLDQFIDRNGQARLEVRSWPKADWSQVVSNRSHENTPTPPLLRAKETQ